MSYLLLWYETYAYGEVQVPDSSEWQYWGLLWLLTPLTLTWVASRTIQPRRKLAAGWSIFALGMVQLLTVFLPGVSLISLGVATGLMLLNTRYWRRQIAAGNYGGICLEFPGDVPLGRNTRITSTLSSRLVFSRCDRHS